jgi:hypothetical protein
LARVCPVRRERRAADVDNPFAPAYLLDAIGIDLAFALRRAEIWKPLMDG